MAIHIYLILTIVISAIIIYNRLIFVNKSVMTQYNNTIVDCGKKFQINTKNSVFLSICFILLLLVAGFRGDFTTDYINYVSIYRIVEHKSFYEVLTTQNSVEVLYAIMNKLIAIIFNDYRFVFITSAFIMIYYTFKEVKKNSEYVWISILIYLCIGSYFTSFNLTRQIMAAAMIFGASKYLYQRKFSKYFICVVVTSLFHNSTIIMLAFYFVLNVKWNKNIVKILSPIYFSFLVSTYIFAPQIINIVRRFFYADYLDNSYGMSAGLGIQTIGKPLIVLLYILFNYKLIDMNNIKERIWFNASIYYFLFCLIGLRIEMVQRFNHFFAPFILLIIPLIISRKKTKQSKMLNAIIVTAFLIVYSIFTMDSNYYFWAR